MLISELDASAAAEDALRCEILWLCVLKPELASLIGSGPNQVTVGRLVELWLDRLESAGPSGV